MRHDKSYKIASIVCEVGTIYYTATDSVDTNESVLYSHSFDHSIVRSSESYKADNILNHNYERNSKTKEKQTVIFYCQLFYYSSFIHNMLSFLQ